MAQQLKPEMQGDTPMEGASTTESLLEELEIEVCDRLRDLDLSQQSIEQVSEFLISTPLPSGTQVSFLTDLLVRFILRSNRAKKLPYIYLANDLIQKSMIKRKKQKTDDSAEVNNFHEALTVTKVTNVLTQLFTMLKESENYGPHEQ